MKTKMVTAILLTLFLASMLSTAFITPVKAQEPATVYINPEVLFSDDFEESAMTEVQWQPVTGTWVVEVGEYSAITPSEYPGYAVSYMKDLVVCDFVLEFKTRILETFTNGSDFTGVFFRTNSMEDIFGYAGAGPGYGYLAIIRANGRVDLYRSDGLTNTAIQGKTSAIDPTADYVTFQVEAVGDNIKVYVNGEKFIDAHDSTYSSGCMALHPGRTHSHFDDVCVIEAAPSTLNLKSRGKWITAFIEPDPVLFSDTFSAESGTEPDQIWEVISGEWEVLDYEYQQTGNLYIPGARAFAGDTCWTDYTVTAKVKITDDGWGGLLLRGNAAGDTYYELYLQRGGRLQLVKTVTGARVGIMNPYVGWFADEYWYIKAQVVDNVVRGKAWPCSSSEPATWLVEWTDYTSPITIGRIGLITFSWWNTQLPVYFDDVLVTTSAQFIDVNTVRLDDTVPAVTDPKYDFVSDPNEYLTDIDKDGIRERLVKFDRAAVIALLSVGEATLTITGEISGITFEGSDTIRVISKGK